jgi:glucoamylase
MRAGEVLRVQANAEFSLRWSIDNWQTWIDVKSGRNSLEIDYVDLKEAAGNPAAAVSFTFFWTASNNWEGHDYQIQVQ